MTDLREQITELFKTLFAAERETSPFYCDEHNAENVIQWLIDITRMGISESEFGFRIPIDFDFSYLEKINISEIL